MRVPHIVRIGALVLATTGFYTYVGQMVPQKEVQPPEDTDHPERHDHAPTWSRSAAGSWRARASA